MNEIKHLTIQISHKQLVTRVSSRDKQMQPPDKQHAAPGDKPTPRADTPVTDPGYMSTKNESL